jgi:hypothetical protein
MSIPAPTIASNASRSPPVNGSEFAGDDVRNRGLPLVIKAFPGGQRESRARKPRQTPRSRRPCFRGSVEMCRFALWALFGSAGREEPFALRDRKFVQLGDRPRASVEEILNEVWVQTGSKQKFGGFRKCFGVAFESDHGSPLTQSVLCTSQQRYFCFLNVDLEEGEWQVGRPYGV